jgi:hypothetical protein
MGWAKGSEMAVDIWEIVRDYIPTQKHRRRDCARRIYNIFCDEDADDWNSQDSIIEDAEIEEEHA